MLKLLFIPINRAGWPFILLFFIVAVGLFLASPYLGIIGFILTVWCIYFFRDPSRVTPKRPGLVISPADGIVQKITTVTPPKELQLGIDSMKRVSIFMNVFDVHVNRIPISGTITQLTYCKGKFFNASLDKASEFNERLAITLQTNQNISIGFVQIAGLVARRIKCNLNENQSVNTGERFGIIRFGSRVDVYLPLSTTIFCVKGQKTVAGETVIADFDSKEESRLGDII